MVILDLEDSVAAAGKDAARAAAVEAARLDWGGRLLAVRLNGPGPWHEADIDVLAKADGIDLVVVPKVETAAYAEGLAARLSRPLLAMIETPIGIYAAREIAGVPGVAGLLAGSNDLAATLRLPSGRAGLMLALQSIVLAARAAGIAVFDGVFNVLDDPVAFEADCRAGRDMGFDGKSLVHPNQIEAANRIFGPSPEELEDARALIAAFSGGAERFRGRMIEAMHVDAARRTLKRAGAT
jgi:citrate lyase subunit beta/citryl-CoA lyase